MTGRELYEIWAWQAEPIGMSEWTIGYIIPGWDEMTIAEQHPFTYIANRIMRYNREAV